MERKEGFYWVKVKDDWRWSTQIYEHGMWHVVVDENGFTSLKDEDIFSINETRIPSPDEEVSPPIYVEFGGQRIAFLSEEKLKNFMCTVGVATVVGIPDNPKVYNITT